MKIGSGVSLLLVTSTILVEWFTELIKFVSMLLFFKWLIKNLPNPSFPTQAVIIGLPPSLFIFIVILAGEPPKNLEYLLELKLVS